VGLMDIRKTKEHFGVLRLDAAFLIQERDNSYRKAASSRRTPKQNGRGRQTNFRHRARCIPGAGKAPF
ncbi:MAG: hypothetical protein ABR607_17330, partial [Pyrinomonadaceae bacterium]